MYTGDICHLSPVYTFHKGGGERIALAKGVVIKASTNGFTLKSHFEGKDASVRATYDRLLKIARQFGQVIEEPKKTSIHLVNKTAFAGVVTRKGAIALTIKSDRKLSSPRIHKTERTSANRFHHELKLISPAEVDPEFGEVAKGCLRAERVAVRQTSVCRSHTTT
ncbi:MAG TPA: DUF5655 domain-containing protein [Pyrinomonadaceae bacterium]|nr:DUF5655 domain-containing protein [Pyrinomonadaceae bacterium]